MSIIVDFGDYVETSIVVEVSTDEALKIIKQNFKENIEAGAPPKLLKDHIRAVTGLKLMMVKMYNERKR